MDNKHEVYRGKILGKRDKKHLGAEGECSRGRRVKGQGWRQESWEDTHETHRHDRVRYKQRWDKGTPTPNLHLGKDPASS